MMVLLQSKKGVGIYNFYSAATIKNNYIIASDACIYSRFHAEYPQTTTYRTKISNNVLLSLKQGIYNDYTRPLIINNTIISGSDLVSGDCYGIINNNGSSSHICDPSIINNIIINKSGTNNVYAIYENSSALYCNPSEIKNNLIFTVNPIASSYIYNDYGSPSVTVDDVSGDENLDDELKTQGQSSGPVISGSIDSNITYPNSTPITSLSSIFYDPDNTVTNDNLFDNYRLKATNKAIGTGLNLYNDANYSNIINDIENSPRPSSGAWDIGAYINK